MFGTRASKAELVLMSQGLKGPSWLSIKNAVAVQRKNHVSWCELEFEVESQFDVTLFKAPVLDANNNAVAGSSSGAAGSVSIDLPSPNLSVASLSLKTLLVPNSNTHEIVAATLRFHNSVNIDNKTLDEAAKETVTFIRPPKGMVWPHDFKTKASAFRHGALLAFDAENILLMHLLRKLESSDPDVIVSHDLHGWGMDLLLQRARQLKVGQQWSKIGRLKRTNPPRESVHVAPVDAGAGAGRLLVDTQLSAQEFLMGSKMFTLPFLAQEQLQLNLREVAASATALMFGRSDSILELATMNVQDAHVQLALMFKLELIPLTAQLTMTCGNLWSRTLRSARAERVEYLLLHAFTRAGFIPPEKLTAKEREAREALDRRLGLGDDGEPIDDVSANNAASSVSGKKSRKRGKAKYVGGRVLEPKKGFYDTWVAVLDFNSLYPSIIREYNLCFSTMTHWVRCEDLDALLPPAVDAENNAIPTGILPGVVGHLIERRKVVRDMLKLEKNAGERSSLNIRQLALKLVANSMYGCLGFPSSRFYCQPIAALITTQGRRALEAAVSTAEVLRGSVIYGDTDSIMVNTLTSSLKLARDQSANIRKAINKPYKILRIGDDGMFKSMLLLKKKKYAALKLTEETLIDERNKHMFDDEAKINARDSQSSSTVYRVDRESYAPQEKLLRFERTAKGLDSVRRDWAPISREAADHVLGLILADRARDDLVSAIRVFLEELSKQIDSGEVPLDKFVMTKSLSKPPEDYADIKALPHVNVALAMINEGKVVRVNDVIEYVFTEGSGSIAERAMHKTTFTDALAKAKKPARGTPSVAPVIDIKYYKEQQILPPIMRLCEVIEDITPEQLALALGLDASRFRRARAAASGGASSYSDVFGNDDEDADSASSLYDKYKQCTPLKIVCPVCDVSYHYPGVYNFVQASQLTHLKSLVEAEAAESKSSGASQSLLATGDSGLTMELLMARLHTDPAAVQRLVAPVSAGGAATSGGICGLRCPTPGCGGANESPDLVATVVCNTLSVAIHGLLRRYASSQLKPEGHDATRDPSVALRALGGRHDTAFEAVKRDLSDSAVYNQVSYYAWLFDVDAAATAIEAEQQWRVKNAAAVATSALGPVDATLTVEEQQVFYKVHRHVNALLERFSHHWISLADIFGI